MKYVKPEQTNMLPSLWQEVLDQSVGGILVCQAIRQEDQQITDFDILLTNSPAEKLLGLSKKQLIGHRMGELFPKLVGSDLWREIIQVTNTEGNYHQELFYELSYANRTGWFDVTINPLPHQQGVVISFSDISALKQAQQLLLGDSILFRALSSTVPDTGVVVIDFFQKIINANGQIPGLFVNANPDALIGHHIIETIAPEFKEDWQQYIKYALSGEAHSFSAQWGIWRSEVYVGPVRNNLGVVVMVMLVFRNVTEQYRQQQALQQANLALKRSNESLERFAYVASHDLQEPLRKIQSFGDMLESQYGVQLDNTAIDLIQRMRSASNRMGNLIRSLLSYARLNTQTPIPGVVRLEELFEDIRNDLDVTIQEKSTVIDVNSPLPTVVGDQTQLHQLFQNLLANAMKFVPKGVQPQLVIKAQVVNGVYVPSLLGTGLNIHQSFVEISIRDNGIGISTENYDKIFGLFSRLHGKQEYSGTGIGLATCKRIAENHQGAITVESELGKGTIFRVYLPEGKEK